MQLAALWPLEKLKFMDNKIGDCDHITTTTDLHSDLSHKFSNTVLEQIYVASVHTTVAGQLV